MPARARYARGLNERMTDDGHSRDPRSDAARNHQVLVRAATAAVHREGVACAHGHDRRRRGSGHRHAVPAPPHPRGPARLPHPCVFEQVLANAEAAAGNGATATEALRQFIESAIGQRNSLVLPPHGGHPRPGSAPVSSATTSTRSSGRSPTADVRTAPSPGMSPARRRGVWGDARPATGSRPGLGRDLPPAPRHLPGGPERSAEGLTGGYANGDVSYLRSIGTEGPAQADRGSIGNLFRSYQHTRPRPFGIGAAGCSSPAGSRT